MLMTLGNLLSGGSAKSQTGAVVVMVAVWMPVLIAISAFAIEAGNWWTHKRHLQVQADAAALAGGGGFVVPCDNARINQETTKYSGTPGATFNAQIGGTPPENVHMLVNSPTYYNQETPVDTTVRTGEPCEAKMVDVKLTETDLPWFFRALNVPFINAHARVAIRQITEQRGALPVAVPEVNPKQVKAVFIDEASGAEIGSTALAKNESATGTLAIWDNVTAPIPVTMDHARIGVRIVMSGSETSTTCGAPLVECYDAGSANGLVSLRSWPDAPAVTASDTPALRDATLTGGGTCSDPTFSTGVDICTAGVSARIDFGVPEAAAKVLASVGGNKTYPLAYNPTSGRWESEATIPFNPEVGPTNVELRWEKTTGTWTGLTCNANGNNPCKSTFGTVQRHFSAAEGRSGPIEELQVWEGTSYGGHSYVRGTTHDLVVRVGIQGSLGYAQSVDDPLVVLRVAGGGSQNQSLDCDPGAPTLREEIAIGCAPSYAVNAGDGCGDVSTPPALWASPQPWDCVALQTGAATNQVPAGMNLRVLGDPKPAYCTSPNNWADFPDIPNDDPRIVQIFLTPYGSFSGSGSGVVPITNFATFYVTGWGSSGSGFANPCTANGDDTVAGDKSGYIYGHFIKYIQTFNNGSGGTEYCDFATFGSCIAQLEE